MPTPSLRNMESFLDSDSPNPRVSQPGTSAPVDPEPANYNVNDADITEDPQDEAEGQVDFDAMEQDDLMEAFIAPRMIELKTLLNLRTDTPDNLFKDWLVDNSDILRHAFTGTLPNPATYVHQEGQVFEINVTRERNLLIMERIADLTLEIDWQDARINRIIHRLCSDKQKHKYRSKHCMRKHFNHLPPVVMYRRLAKDDKLKDGSRARFERLVEMRKNRPQSLLRIVERIASRTNSEASSKANSSKASSIAYAHLIMHGDHSSCSL